MGRISRRSLRMEPEDRKSKGDSEEGKEGGIKNAEDKPYRRVWVWKHTKRIKKVRVDWEVKVAW